MLLAIREKSKGWFAWVIVGALVVPLAFFGVYNYVQGPPPSEIAFVNDVTITDDQIRRAVQNQRMRLEQMFGGQLDPSFFDEQQLRREALNGLINEALLTEFAQKQRLTVSDAALAAAIFQHPAFQENGSFSPELYELVLRSNGLSPTAFESQQRLSEAIGQLQNGVYGSEFTTDAELQRLLALQRQERELVFLTVSAEAQQVSVSDEEVEAYYQDNPQQFQRPEAVQLAYVELSRDTLAEQIELSDEELQARYEELKDSRYTHGGERRVRHILLQLPESAPAEQVEAARDELTQLRQQIESGQIGFEEAAREFSDDPGSASNGGDLGLVARGDMVEAFEEAAFSLPEGELSEPVRSPFGLHLIQVTEIGPREVQSFADVRDELRNELIDERLGNRLLELGNRLANLAYEHPDSLEPAAEALGLEVRQSDWIPRGGSQEGLGAHPELVEAAFDDEVLREGRNSGVIELRDGSQLAVRVADHQPAEALPLVEVAADIRTQLQRQKAADAARERGEALRAELAEGKPAQELAQADDVELADPGFVSRSSDSVPAAVRAEVFQLPKPAEGEASIGTARLPNGDYAVLKVSGVRQGEAGEDGESIADNIRDQLQALHGSGAMRGLLAVLREQAKIEIREDRL